MATTAALLACDSDAPPRTIRQGDPAASDVKGGEVGWTAAEQWQVVVSPLQTIGVRDGDEDHQFFEVTAAARQADGDLVVADGGSRTVRLYDREGTFKMMLGGAGSGPGEFREPTQIVIQAGDSISVWDNTTFRITKFDAEGGLAGVHSFDRSTIAKAVETPLYPGPALLSSNGDLFVRLVEKSKDVPVAARFRQASGALRVSADLSEIRLIMDFGDVEKVLVETPWGPLPVVPALAKTTSIAVHPGEPRVCIGDQEGPEVKCFDEEGVVTRFRWGGTHIPVREDERTIEVWRAAIFEDWGQKLSPSDVQRVVEQIPIPTEWPPYSNLVLDREGNLWVARGPGDGGEGPVTEHLVFNPSGELLGSVLAPSIRILEIGSDYVLGVYEDEFEVQYLQVHELVKPSVTRGPT